MTDDQSHHQSRSVQKLRLGGIKFSEAQVRMVFAPVVSHSVLTRIFAGFAKHRINLHQLAFSEDIPGGIELYLGQQDYERNRSLISSELEPFGLDPVVVSPVGTLTLFPHAARMDVLLKVINLAGSSDLQIYGVFSSLSALCVTTDLSRLDTIANVLFEDFSLPEGHSPFRYQPSDLDLKLTGGQGRVVETIAQYWEPIIKIYGSSLKTGLTKFTISCDGEQLPVVIAELTESGIPRFEMTGLTRAEAGRYHLHLMIDPAHDPTAVTSMRNRFGVEPGIDFSERHGMELLFFHGPHFQDRYGVIHAAVSALAKASIDIHGAACSGTGVHLVAEEHIGSRMLEVLSEVFVVP